MRISLPPFIEVTQLLQLVSLLAPCVPDVYARFGWLRVPALILATHPGWSRRTA